MSDEIKQSEQEKALVAQEQFEQRSLAREVLKTSPSIFLNVVKFEHCQRVATMLVNSTMVPEHFRGNIGNCMIALNLADRYGADVFMLMQTMYIVHGKPGLEGKMIAALINSSGRYSDELKYEVEESGSKTDKKVDRPDRVRAYATSSKSGELVHGPWVSWDMANAEGWTVQKKTQISKWQTMPEMMFRYRAASYFANTNCPEVKLGMMTTEEIKDISADDSQAEIKDNANQVFIDMDEENIIDTEPLTAPEPEKELTPEVNETKTKEDEPAIEKPVFIHCPVGINKSQPRKSTKTCAKCKNKDKCGSFQALNSTGEIVEPDKEEAQEDIQAQPEY